MNIFLSIVTGLFLYGFLYTNNVLGNEAAEEAIFENELSSAISTRILQNPLEMPTSMTVLTREQIAGSGMIEIPDLLRQVPGFQVAHFKGNQFVVSYHGQGANFYGRLEVTIDGRSVYRPFLSSVDWTNLGVNLEDIERIEIVRGSNAAAFGSNAFISAINIVTIKPNDVAFDKDSSTTVNVTGGSRKMNKIYFRKMGKKENLSYRISGAWRKDEGFHGDMDKKNIVNVNLWADIPLKGNWGNLEVSAGFDDGRLGVHDPSALGNPTRINKVHNQYQFIHYYKNKIKGKDDLHIRFYHNYHDINDEYTVPTPVFVPGKGLQTVKFATKFGTNNRYDLEIEKLVTPSKNTQFVIGAGFRKDSFKSKWYLGHSGTITESTARAFANIEHGIKDHKIILNAGFTFEANEEHGKFLSPRVGINYKLNDKSAIRFSHTRGTRLPSILENNTNYSAVDNQGEVIERWRYSDPNLKPEKIEVTELAYHFNKSNNMSLDVKVFRETVPDILKELKDGNGTLFQDHYIRSNAGCSSLDGIEIELHKKLTPKDKVKLSYTRIINPKIRLQDDIGAMLMNNDDIVPKNTLSLSYTHEFKNKKKLNVNHYYTSAMKWPENGNSVGTINRTDINVSTPFKRQGVKGKLTFGIQNIGKPYKEYENMNAFKTRGYLQMEMNF